MHERLGGGGGGGGGGRVVLYHNPRHRLSFHSGHRVLLHLNSGHWDLVLRNFG